MAFGRHVAGLGPLTKNLLCLFHLLGVEVFDQKNSVQMVHLMLEQPGLEFVGFDAHLIAIEISSDEQHRLGPDDRPGQPGDRKTPLLVLPLTVDFDDLRIDHHVWIFAQFEVVNEHPLPHAHLGCCQPKTRLFIHGVEHVLGQFGQVAVDVGDLTRDLLQHGIAVCTDSVGGAHTFKGYRCFVVSEANGPPEIGATSHYFDEQPSAVSRPRAIELVLPDVFLTLHTDRAVFSASQVDSGTRYLLQEMPEIPADSRTIVDLGCGYGPIALTTAARAPNAVVWAVDVNERARFLTSENAHSNGLTNVRVGVAQEVPSDPPIDLIISNPPIRIGKEALRALLAYWLERLSPGGRAWLVVHKHLGSDSLADWLRREGYETTRLGSRKGYRILEVLARGAAESG